MRTIIPLALSATILLLITSCRTENLSPYQKKWKAKLVKENGLVVYEEGSPNNLQPAYKNFQLDISQKEVVVLTEFTGNPMTGKWQVVENLGSNPILKLSELLPQPDGTDGVIEYIIQKAPSNDLILTNSKANHKTGNSVNEYTMIPIQ